jgi:polysaccharide export outer membrane protein
MTNSTVIVRFGFLIAVISILTGCVTPTPTEVSSDGEITYLNEREPAEKKQARDAVFQGMTQGARQYRLVPGDQLEFMFHLQREPAEQEYEIKVGNRLGVEFFYQPNASRSVVVRPDGMITLPIKGDLRAAGLTATKLAEVIQQRYSDIFKDPVVSVSVEEFSSAYDDLNSALGNIQGGRVKRVTIAPDGQIFLPLIPPVQAGGLAVEDVRLRANELYQQQDANVSVSINLEQIAGSRIFVFGEVKNPGMLTLQQAQTALQAVTTAGGALTTGSMENVKVVYWTPEGESRVRTLNLQAVLNGEDIEQDMLLPSNTAVYVPPSSITKANRWVDQYIRQLFLFNGVSANVTYLINGTVIQ